MSFFTSKRERRLWLRVLAILAAIYSTLGFAGRLAGGLLGESLLGAIFALSGVLVLVTIMTQGLRWRPGGFEIAVGLGVTAAYLLVIVRLGIPGAERTHLIEYGVLALLMYEALMERARHGRRVPHPALLAIALTALLGLVDESIQAVLPERVFDLRDLGFNALAGLMAIGASLALGWTRRWNFGRNRAGDS